MGLEFSSVFVTCETSVTILTAEGKQKQYDDIMILFLIFN